MITCRGILEIESRVFRTGISAETLMEKVGRRMARVILRDHPISGRVEAYLGKGHNAGDALVVLRVLKQEGWQVSVKLAFPETEMAVLTRKKLRELGELGSDHGFRRGPHLLLDGMLGIGTEGSLREPLLGMAEEMNERRLNSGARVVAMDIPTGLDADTGGEGAVVADLTLTVGIPKLGLVADSATDFVGRLELIEVEELPLPEEGDRLISRQFLRPRPFSFHKGQAGRVGIIAGSPGLLGAAALACHGALRGGAGLITLWAEKELLSDLRAMVSPEVMIRELGDDWAEVCQLNPDALVIGPGLGSDCSDSLFRLLEKNQPPTVLDADALNLIATHERQDLLGANILATPHLGEMARLHSVEGARAEIAR
ncbi:MAG: NAD(P)H-hydrate epimerase, partial [Verrucomicrobiaceae bacterium TMED86]